MAFSLPLRVYIEDTDAGGIVFYVNYLKYMERARTEWLRSLGFGKAGANREGFQFVVRRIEVEYQLPAVLDDELSISAELKKLGGASMEIVQKVWRGDSILCHSKVELACVSGSSLKPVRMPSQLLEKLKPFELQG